MNIDQLVRFFIKGWWILAACTLVGYWIGTIIDTKTTVVYSTVGGFEVKLPASFRPLFIEEYKATTYYREMLLDNALGFRELSPYGVCCVEAVTEMPDEGKKLVLEFLEGSLNEAQQNFDKLLALKLLALKGNEAQQNFDTLLALNGADLSSGLTIEARLRIVRDRMANEDIFVTKLLSPKAIETNVKPLILFSTSGVGMLLGLLLLTVVYWRKYVGD